MARLIVKSAELAPLVIELKHGPNRVGRSAENDHPLEASAISDQHCEIVVGDDAILVRDLNSTNGTFIDGRAIKESQLESGQTLQLGDVELILEADPRISIPDLPPIENPLLFEPEKMPDGYSACLEHVTRHAVWECTNCSRVYCDECIKKLRRVGGVQIKLCPTCSNPCRLTEWAEMAKGRKKSFISAIADKVKTRFKRTRVLLNGGEMPAEKKKPRSK